MIYPYIKVNKKVVDFLGVADQRYIFPDGNYMLWKLDLLPLGGNNEETIRMIGGAGMSSEQVRAEQRGGEPLPLPEAEDERFRMVEESAEGTVAEEQPEPGDSENGGEVTGEPNEESGEGDDNE